MHSDSGDLADDVDFFREAVDLRGAHGCGVRLKNELFSGESAPAASKTGARFEEINRAFKLVGPSTIDDFSLAFVNQNEGAGLDKGIHTPVFGTHKCIAMIANFQAI